MALCFGTIFVLALGGLSLFGKDIMWELTQWDNRRKGVVSERTESWETMTTVAGVVYIILGLIGLYALFKNG
ncbi:MAG TPA: hypothetical protein VFI68_07090 [Anaerolineales bacterium]|nr:hypothetical protein [Anaerolineales bacterium]